ncbi:MULTISPECIES: hypothetical protein [Actinomyces]|uniref:Uncharacterized protein n=1 Tax=Actinomyces marmotae TaxID=2737173 RepID=A0A6M8B7B4_9ACTO|nr:MULTISPECIES: hypothetical protein [Actinomyces]QKD79123.1 hypothetical protein HPC72_01590 [Actinomyces marmotae]
MVSVVLALSVLLGSGAAAYAVLRSSAPKALNELISPSRNTWSTDWLNGTEEAWSYGGLESPSTHEEDRVKVIKAGSKLVRFIIRGESTLVTVLQESERGVELLWEQDLGHALPEPGVWKNWVVDGGDLIDLDTQERVRAPWPADATVSAAHGIAIACEGLTCTLWTSRYDDRWTRTIESSNSTIAVGLSALNNNRYALALGDLNLQKSDKVTTELLALDLENGSTRSMGQITGAALVAPLSDGWLVGISDKFEDEERVSLYSPDGTPLGDARRDDSKDYGTFPYSPTPISAEQARAWIENADTSWAPSTMKVSAEAKDGTCSATLVHGDATLSMPGINSLTRRSRTGTGNGAECRLLPVTYTTMMGTGPLAEVREVRDHDLYLHLVDPGSGAESGAMRIGDLSSWNVTPDGGELIAYDDSGRLTAYRPKPAA